MPNTDTTPQKIKDFDELLKKARRMNSATELSSTGAYIAAVKAAGILNEAGDEADYSVLEDDARRAQFGDALHTMDVANANQFYGANVDAGDPLKSNGLRQAYNGKTQSLDTRTLEEHKSDYRLQLFEQIRDKSMQSVVQRNNQSAAGKLSDSDTADLIKYKGLDEIVDPGMMKIGDAVQVTLIAEQLRRRDEELTKSALKRFFTQQDAEVPHYIRD